MGRGTTQVALSGVVKQMQPPPTPFEVTLQLTVCVRASLRFLSSASASASACLPAYLLSCVLGLPACLHYAPADLILSRLHIQDKQPDGASPIKVSGTLVFASLPVSIQMVPAAPGVRAYWDELGVHNAVPALEGSDHRSVRQGKWDMMTWNEGKRRDQRRGLLFGWATTVCHAPIVDEASWAN